MRSFTSLPKPPIRPVKRWASVASIQPPSVASPAPRPLPPPPPSSFPPLVFHPKPRREIKEEEKKAEEKGKKGEEKKKAVVNVSILPTKDKLVTAADKLSHSERIAWASQLGYKHRTTAELKHLVTELRTHPPKAALTKEKKAEVEDDEEDSEEDGVARLLPRDDQSRNPDFYHEDEMALRAAAAARQKEVMMQEMALPCTAFRPFCISVVTKPNRKEENKAMCSDEEMVTQTLASAPASQRTFLSACLKHRRTSVLDALVPHFLERFGDFSIARFLHGCSDTLVRLHLPRLHECPKLRWPLLCRFHPNAVLDLLESDLKQAQSKEEEEKKEEKEEKKDVVVIDLIAEVWSEWNSRLHPCKGLENLLFKTQGHKMSRRLLALAFRFAGRKATHHSTHFLALSLEKMDLQEELACVKDLYQVQKKQVQLPALVLTHVGHFWRYFGDQLVAWQYLTTGWYYDTKTCQYQIVGGVYDPAHLPTTSPVSKITEQGLLRFVHALMSEMPFHIDGLRGSENIHCDPGGKTRLEVAKQMWDVVPTYQTELTDLLLNWADVLSTGTETTKYNHSSSSLHFDSLSCGADAIWTFLESHFADKRISLLERVQERRLRSWSSHFPAAEAKNKYTWRDNLVRTSSVWLTHLSSCSVPLLALPLVKKEISFVLGVVYPLVMEEKKKPKAKAQVKKKQAFDDNSNEPEDEKGFWTAMSAYVHNALKFTTRVRKHQEQQNKNSKAIIEAKEENKSEKLASSLLPSAPVPSSIFAMLWKELAPWRLRFVADFTTTWFSHLTATEQLMVWESLTLADFHFLVVEKKPSVFLDLVDKMARVDAVRVGRSLADFYDEDEDLSAAFKEQLLPYVMLTVDDWKSLQKMGDSANPSQRSAAYKHMMAGTLLSRCPKTLVKSLRFISDKIQNEAIGHRVDAIDYLLADVNAADTKPFLAPRWSGWSGWSGDWEEENGKGSNQHRYKLQDEDVVFLLSESALPFWLKMLNDALECRDLDGFVIPPSEKSAHSSGLAIGVDLYISPTLFALALTVLHKTENKEEAKEKVLALLGGDAEKMAWFTNPELYHRQTKHHPVLGYFHQLSIAALRIGASTGSSNLIDFAVEIQWTIAQFRLGAKYAALHFRIDPGLSLVNSWEITDPKKKQDKGKKKSKKNKTKSSSTSISSPLRFKTEREKVQFVELFLGAYQDRIVERNPDWLMDPESLASYITPLCHMLGPCGLTIPPLSDYLAKVLHSIQKSPVDHEGLWIVHSEHPAIALFDFFLSIIPQWQQHPLLVEYVTMLMKSRQARRVFWKWYGWCQYGQKSTTKKPSSKSKMSRSEWQRRRGEIVDELLALSRSSIYLPMVWRYLVRFNQQKLDPFLNAQSMFRGVFYLTPEQRVPKKKIQGGGGESAWTDLIPYDAAATVAAELQMEKEIDAEQKKYPEKRDFPQYWRLPACFQLRRLLPRQNRDLALDHVRAVLNTDRGVPERVKAAALWTLLPTTHYTDVMKFYTTKQRYLLTDEEAAKEKKEEKKEKKEVKEEEKPAKKKPPQPKKAGRGKVKAAKAEETKEKKEETKEKKKKMPGAVFPVNLVETLLRGILCNEDKLTPLRYLLHPEFLATQQARAAVFAIGAAVPHLHGDVFLKLLRAVLTGKRRLALKITAYKEILRLLASGTASNTKNGAAGVKMIMYEWNRKDLHRDVRIAIIQMAFNFLKNPAEAEVERGWEILLSAVHYSEPEILLCLLTATTTATPTSAASKRRQNGSDEEEETPGNELNPYVRDVKLATFMAGMRRCYVPPQHVSRYATAIVSKLMAEDLPDDVLAIATVCASQWINKNEDVAKFACERWMAVLTETETAKILRRNSDDELVDECRRKKATQDLLAFATSTTKPNSMALNYCEGVTAQLLLAAFDIANEREVRAKVMKRLTAWIRAPGDSIRITSPIFQPLLSCKRQGLFARDILRRRLAHCEDILAEILYLLSKDPEDLHVFLAETLNVISGRVYNAYRMQHLVDFITALLPLATIASTLLALPPSLTKRGRKNKEEKDQEKKEVKEEARFILICSSLLKKHEKEENEKEEKQDEEEETKSPKKEQEQPKKWSLRQYEVLNRIFLHCLGKCKTLQLKAPGPEQVGTFLVNLLRTPVIEGVDALSDVVLPNRTYYGGYHVPLPVSATGEPEAPTLKPFSAADSIIALFTTWTVEEKPSIRLACVGAVLQEAWRGMCKSERQEKDGASILLAYAQTVEGAKEVMSICRADHMLLFRAWARSFLKTKQAEVLQGIGAVLKHVQGESVKGRSEFADLFSALVKDPLFSNTMILEIFRLTRLAFPHYSLFIIGTLACSPISSKLLVVQLLQGIFCAVDQDVDPIKLAERVAVFLKQLLNPNIPDLASMFAHLNWTPAVWNSLLTSKSFVHAAGLVAFETVSSSLYFYQFFILLALFFGYRFVMLEMRR